MRIPSTPSLRTSLILAAALGTLVGCNRVVPHESPLVKPMSGLHPQATFTVKGHPDWMAITPDSVWVTSSADNLVSQVRATDNQLGITISVNKPCSGLAVGFGSLW